MSEEHISLDSMVVLGSQSLDLKSVIYLQMDGTSTKPRNKSMTIGHS